ncbi:type II CRISPR-associated endonuclease Cas1 [Planctomycetota bacterium]|nr:type II CRISPR-associated endonuclease Cas1 [Planctomycetota bacterium]
MKRSIVIRTRGTRLTLRQQQCQVLVPNAATAHVPIEDLSAVILETPACTISGACLVAFANSGVALIACGDDHLPASLSLPLRGHTLHTERLARQASMARPLAKNLWGKLVREKILGQAAVLTSEATARRLRAMAREVRSGDPRNLEGQAARLYWPALLGAHFRRDRFGEPPNGLLNYGYAIVRACVARGLAAAGLHPALGLAHRNRYNPFVLADDVIEPWRPFVDRRVRDWCLAEGPEVTPAARASLLGVLEVPAQVDGQTVRLADGVDGTCSSLARAIDAGANGRSAPEAANFLRLPAWPADEHGAPPR